MEHVTELLTAAGMDETIRQMTEAVVALVDSPESLAILGIRTHGVTLAQRMQALLESRHGWKVPLGILDITLYRDDLAQLAAQPIVRTTHLDFDVEDRLVVLVDDVLSTGRTVRCALDEIMDYGRPRAVRLAVLVDRGLRELPICPDITGLAVQTASDERIDVRFGSEGESIGVWVLKPGNGLPQ